MVSTLRLCRATQSARALASATVPIASTSTASYSPKIKVDVIGSKPSGSPKGLGRSPTIVFPGAVKTFTPSVFNATGAVTARPAVHLCHPSGTPLDIRASDCSRQRLAGAPRLAQSQHPNPPQVLTVGEGSALSDLDNVAVRIADVAAYLAVLGYRLRDELRSSTFP